MVTINPITWTAYGVDERNMMGMMQTNASRVETFIENLTGTTSQIAGGITLEFSDRVKYRKSKITPKDIIKDFEDIFSDFDDIGDYPPGHDNIRGWFEDWKERFGDYQDENQNRSYNPEFDPWRDYRDVLGGFIDRITNGDIDWADWADEHGYPDLAGKIKRAVGKYRAATTIISMEYFKNQRKIVIYRNALGDVARCPNEWLSAFACGVFYAYRDDAVKASGSKKKDNTILTQSLMSYFEFAFCDKELSAHPIMHRLYRNWYTCDMAYCPESGALYLKDIEINKHHHMDEYLFRRTFKKSIKDSTGAYEDLKAMYETYEGRKFKSR